MAKKRKRLKVREHQLYTVKPAVWRQLKQDNTIDPVYRFRKWKIELLSRLLTMASSLQSVLFSKKIGQISFEGHPPVFIVGLWRSGTTHLHYMMARDPQFGFLNNHQAFTFNFSLLSLKKLNKIFDIFVPRKRPQDNVRLTLNEPAEEEQALSTLTTHSSIHSFYFPKNQQYFEKYHLFEGISEQEKSQWKKDYLFLLKNIAFYNRKRDLLLKNHHNTGRIKELLELFPDAKFIFLHRDPYTIFRSTKKLYTQMISSQFLQFFSQKETERLIIENNAKILRKYMTEKKLIPAGNLVEIGFDELESAPLEMLKSIYSRLGIDGFEKAKPGIEMYLNSVQHYKKNKYRSLSVPLLKKLHSAWGFWFEAFGYQKRAVSNE